MVKHTKTYDCLKAHGGNTLNKELILELALAENLDIGDQIDFFEKVLSDWLDALRPEFGDVIND